MIEMVERNGRAGTLGGPVRNVAGVGNPIPIE
jgi:hypothetical protein